MGVFKKENLAVTPGKQPCSHSATIERVVRQMGKPDKVVRVCYDCHKEL